MRRRWLAPGLVTGAVLTIATPAWAQGMPAGEAGAELTLPPEMRAAEPQPDMRVVHGGRREPVRRYGASPDPGATPAMRQARPGPAHPVEVGVTMRGGSGTPRLVAPLAGSEAVRESGSAFGAAMKFGF